ncbi:hypothetical protein PVAP13_7KG120766 [Panicum virgatum]|uniref:Uncharacterized protein n=1 Tax=Panicum virgatum TaxID=38727 RepID=A0A8T0QLL6_PANVG|nr:hypothetical protein PVAP13_7KG120766 [Panicum virgatum]
MLLPETNFFLSPHGSLPTCAYPLVRSPGHPRRRPPFPFPFPLFRTASGGRASLPPPPRSTGLPSSTPTCHGSSQFRFSFVFPGARGPEEGGPAKNFHYRK